MLLGALVGRHADMKAMGAGRIHRDAPLQAGALHQGAQHALGRGAAADVAHAHHEQIHGRAARRACALQQGWGQWGVRVGHSGKVVERGEAPRQWLARAIEQAQAGRGRDAAYACDLRTAGTGCGLHGGAPCGRGGEDQLVVVATGECMASWFLHQKCFSFPVARQKLANQ
jgi:hypothetical protein